MKSAERKFVGVLGIEGALAFLRARSVRKGDCLVWLGALDRDGYGIATVRDPARKRTITVRVHRLAFLLAYGGLDRDLTIDHVRTRGCEHKSCIEPPHLEQVSIKENNRRSPNTLAGRNIRKTHCPVGHRLVRDNLEPWALARGKRSCLTCHRAAMRRSAQRRRESGR